MGGNGPVAWESDDRLQVDGTPYVLMDVASSPEELRIFKPRMMLEIYEPILVEFQGARILELGIYQGGSTAYLAQRCDPRRLVALDRSPERVPPLDRFVEAHGLADRVSLHFGIDQADRGALDALVEREFGDDGIDLVIDDASHLYGPTVASFEVLFPHVRPGGLYVIEDWTTDSWLARTFADAIGQREPLARALVEAWLAEAIRAENVVGAVFERWVGRTLDDPGAPDHDAVVQWCSELDRVGVADEARLIRDRIRSRSASDAVARGSRGLGTLGLQLVLAVNGLCSSIASVSVTPFSIEVRRGGPIDHEPFTVESIAVDHVGVLATMDAGPLPTSVDPRA